MPYPPPPPPPDVGEFQAIGKLPAPELPDVTGHGGEFLETDGIIPQWEPVSGVLPDQTGHTGEFLTTDGSVASWAPGGGSGVTTVGTLTSPTSNAASITGVTLNLAPADSSNPGVSSISAQQFSGSKTFIDGAVVETYDVRQFGAVANDETNDFSVAYYSALINILTNAVTNPYFDYQTYVGKVGAIYIPQGSYWTSRPLMLVGNVEVYGDGDYRTYINAGIRTDLDPGKVQGFSGPVFYSCGMVTPSALAAYTANVVDFGPPLNGTSTRSLHLKPTMVTLPLHDSYPWTWFLGMMIDSTKLSLRFEYKIISAPISGEYHIIGTEGPLGVWLDGHVDRAFKISLVSNGTNVKIKAYLTTCPDWTIGTFNMTTGTQVSVISGNLSLNADLNIEVDYDGFNFYLYVDGVHQDHSAAIGPVFRQPWEGATIGTPGMEIDQSDTSVSTSCDSYLGCIEFAKVNRHTGTGSFTPAHGPFTADTDTLWIANWDQVDFPFEPTSTYHLPFLQAETAISLGATNGPDPYGTSGPHLVKHYIRMLGGGGVSNAILRDIHIYSQSNTTGFAAFASALLILRKVASSFACRASFKSTDGNSFYSNIYKCFAYAPCDYGMFWYGNIDEPFTLGARIGVQNVFG